MDEELHPNLFKPLLDFIPYFESNRKKYNCSEEMSFDPYIYHEPAKKFVEQLYNSQFILSFDWMSWQSEARKYFDNLLLIDEADLNTIRKLFTTIIRADRFNAGTYALMIDNGVILCMLMRLKALIDEIEDEKKGYL